MTNQALTSHKKTLGIFSLTSCEGCQFELLGHYEAIQKLLNYFTIESFRLGQSKNNPTTLDIALIEGNPGNDKEVLLLKEIRKNSKIVIAIGACAIIGGIQSQRNNLPKKLIDKKNTITVKEVIRLDYMIPGCPINATELTDCLLHVHSGTPFSLSDLPVCFECHKNNNACLLHQKKFCLGPITRGGCNSICTNNNEACLGCRGPADQANFIKLKETLKPLVGEEELVNLLNFYGDYEAEAKRQHKQ